MRRGVLKKKPLSVDKILMWMDDHRARTGRWPGRDSGYVLATTDDERWSAIDTALRLGHRGLPGNSSLVKLLATRRGVRHRSHTPRLALKQIVRWAREHQARTGRWPTTHSGSIHGASGETWKGVDAALRSMGRGLRVQGTLVQVLARHVGRRPRLRKTALVLGQIKHWGRSFRKRHGCWPGPVNEAVREAPGETWGKIDQALRQGYRGLPGGSSLGALFGVKKGRKKAPLSLKQIGWWADAYFREHARWPVVQAGGIPGGRGLTWRAVDAALRQGHRGLKGGSSLYRFLKSRRGPRRRG